MSSFLGLRCLRRLRCTPFVRQLATLPRVTAVHSPRVQEGVLLPPFDIQIPDCTYPEFIWEGLAGQAHLPALVCGLTGRSLTHGQVHSLALRLSASLQQLLPPSSVVGVLLPNCPEYAVLVLGTLHAGLTLTTLNPSYTPGELAHQLAASRAQLLVTSYSLQDKVAATASLLPRLDTVLFLEAEAEGEAVLAERSHLPFYSFLSSSPASSSPSLDPARQAAVLPFSSGTTGRPKGVMVSHRNLITQTLSLAADGEYYYRAFGQSQDTTLAVLPMFHIFGLGVTMSGALWSGAKQVTLPRFSSLQYTAALETHRPTWLHLVPPMVGFLASSPTVTKKHLSYLREVICGAAPCGSQLISQFMQKAPPTLLFKEGWGMTEVGGGACNVVRSVLPPVHGSVNQVLPTFRLRVVDPHSGEVLPVGHTGEIQVLGDGVMLGYLDNEEATAASLSPQGWLSTGDIGHFTEEGVVYISDRLKELIKVNGLQVAPAELEDVLRGLEGVEDVAVVAREDERAGQLPRAFIVRTAGLTEEKVREHMAEHLAPHKQLQGGVVFLEEIPKSASGKILRRQLQGL